MPNRASGPSTANDDAVQEILKDETIASPLNRLLGIDNELVAADPETTVALCMADAGFEYVPAGPIPELDAGSDTPPNAITGYGIADRLELALSASQRPDSDPNEQIRAALTPSERAAYDLAMSGIADPLAALDPKTGAPVDEADFLERSKDGCLYKAYNTAEVLSQRKLELLQSAEYADLQREIAADPEMIELEQGWRRCMNDKGYRYQNRGEILNDLYRRADAAAERASMGPISEKERRSLIDSLRADELAIAPVDSSCSTELETQGPVIVRRHEIDFIESNMAMVLAAMEDERSVASPP